MKMNVSQASSFIEKEMPPTEEQRRDSRIYQRIHLEDNVKR